MDFCQRTHTKSKQDRLPHGHLSAYCLILLNTPMLLCLGTKLIGKAQKGVLQDYPMFVMVSLARLWREHILQETTYQVIAKIV